MKTLDWVKANVHPKGGIRAWADHYKAYPEVTGYLIPTLLRYGEDELARDFADWLLTMQNADGSFDGLDGVARTFDTAACYEGLMAAFAKLHKMAYWLAAGKARRWLGQLQNKGRFYVDGKKDRSEIYGMRINGIYPWYIKPPEKPLTGRTHYIAYALEGLKLVGHRQYVEKQVINLCATAKDGLVPYKITGQWASEETDTCATAQIAVLMLKMGMDASKLLDALDRMVLKSGGLALRNDLGQEASWTAKFYLDARYYSEQL